MRTGVVLNVCLGNDPNETRHTLLPMLLEGLFGNWTEVSGPLLLALAWQAMGRSSLSCSGRSLLLQSLVRPSQQQAQWTFGPARAIYWLPAQSKMTQELPV